VSTRTTRQPASPPPPTAPGGSRERQERSAAGEPPGRRRRPTSAWRAFAIAGLGVVIGLLLDAPGLHKSAFNQQVGWQRTVALDVTGELERVSHAVYLDRPRSALKSALGRSHDDRIDTNIDIPVAAAAPSAASQPSGSLRPAFSPAHPLRLWIAGDSLIVSPGYALQRVVEHSATIKSVGGVLDLISRAGAYTVWIGLPFTRDPGQSARFERINAVVAQEIAKRPRTAVFVPTDLLLAGSNGGFSQYLILPSGEMVDARAPDGVHLSTDGGQIVAQKIVEQLYKMFDLTSWRHRSSKVTAPG